MKKFLVAFLMVFYVGVAGADDIVKGTVKDKGGKLPGASVCLDGTKNCVVADEGGVFELNITSNKESKSGSGGG